MLSHNPPAEQQKAHDVVDPSSMMGGTSSVAATAAVLQGREKVRDFVFSRTKYCTGSTTSSEGVK